MFFINLATVGLHAYSLYELVMCTDYVPTNVSQKYYRLLSNLCFESSVHSLIKIFLNPSKYYFAAKGVRVSFRARWQATTGASVTLHDS